MEIKEKNDPVVMLKDLSPGLICPRCDGPIDAAVVKKMQDDADFKPSVPFICSHCASIGLFTLSNLTIKVIPDEFLPILANHPDCTVMWARVQQLREKILALPNRRPVLR